jgi:hypothetical protein
MMVLVNQPQPEGHPAAQNGTNLNLGQAITKGLGSIFGSKK